MVDVNMDFGYAAVTNTGTTTTRINSLGVHPNIGTATTPVDIWSGAVLGTLNGIDHRNVQIPQTPVNMEMVSTSVNDTAAGTGCRTVRIVYLDANYDQQIITLNTNGTTPVALPIQILRINAFTSIASGTFGGNNLGNISIRLVGGLGATYSYMPIGVGVALSSLYTVPNKLVFDTFVALTSINRTDTNDRYAVFTIPIQTRTGSMTKAIRYNVSTFQPFTLSAHGWPIASLPATTDVWIRCEGVSANATDVTATLFGIQRNPTANQL